MKSESLSAKQVAEAKVLRVRTTHGVANDKYTLPKEFNMFLDRGFIALRKIPSSMRPGVFHRAQAGVGNILLIPTHEVQSIEISVPDDGL